MRNAVIIVFLTTISLNSLGQDFAPIGAKWYYDLFDSPVIGPWKGYILFESIKDTLIQSQNCRLIKKTWYNSSGSVLSAYSGTEIMYSDSGKIYHYYDSSFYVLYDFSAQINDSWNIRIPYNIYSISDNPNDTIRKITLDSISTMVINTDTFKVLHVSSDSNDWYFADVIVETIGCLHFMFSGIWGLWDDNVAGSLRCYSDDSINIQFNAPCDTLVNTIENLGYNTKAINIYPNPFSTFTTVEIPKDYKTVKKLSLALYDLMGTEVKRIENITSNKIKINRDNLSPGLYFYKLEERDQILATGKVVIQ
ncbi:MAG: T9SS type A sorting domain-containing protein [Bacteroidetes bacterium]|nr:T9SS type A sorting domain-containing protein [Bacteroidota bacterium]